MDPIPPLISVITVNYNHPEETLEFLESLYKSDYKHYEVIVVDNGSTIKHDKSLESKYARLTYIHSKKNLGFAGGNNLGVIASKGEYLFFLNNDTIVPPDFLSKMVSFLEASPEAGIASPKVIFPDEIIQYAGAVDINPLTGRGKRIGLMSKDSGQYDKNYLTDLPHGAAMVIPRKVIAKVGFMPEEYFLYYEEHDWCMRIREEGYKMYYVGETFVIHKESRSVGQDSPLKVYYMNRNRLLFLKRNSRGLSKLMGMLFFLFIALPKNSFKYLSKGEIKQFTSLWRGVLWHLSKKYDYRV